MHGESVIPEISIGLQLNELDVRDEREKVFFLHKMTLKAGVSISTVYGNTYCMTTGFAVKLLCICFISFITFFFNVLAGRQVIHHKSSIEYAVRHLQSPGCALLGVNKLSSHFSFFALFTFLSLV